MKWLSGVLRRLSFPFFNVLVVVSLILSTAPTAAVRGADPILGPVLAPSSGVPSLSAVTVDEVQPAPRAEPQEWATPLPESPAQPETVVVQKEIESAGVPAAISGTATVLAQPDKDSELTSPSGKITLQVPAGAVSAATNIEIIERIPASTTGMAMVRLFDLNASAAATGQKVTQFSKDLQITLKHDPVELRGLDPDTLKLYYLDETTRRWLPVASSYDKRTGSLTSVTNHFTRYGEQANPTIVGPGRVLAAQVDLHSGASVFSYPIELPPGPGGFKPKLELTYNSGVADEMKNKNSLGSWVGIGWTLHLGRISYDLQSDTYYLDWNGGSYQLVTSDGTNFRTNPDQFYKITRSTNTWEMRDREGYYYRFGGTSDSEQHLTADYGGAYRWDLNLMKDPNNNQATVGYIQNIVNADDYYGHWIRSAYPSALSYGNVAVYFTSGYDYFNGVDLIRRNDNPYVGKVVENRRLNSISVRVSGTEIRKYVFAYTTTTPIYSEDYGGTYYAGAMTLTSVKQVGADGSSELPAMTFSYEYKQIYRNGSGEQYQGNPGNPASMSWPHLTAVNSGYGGSVSFGYTQKPAPSILNVWTREVATTRTVNPGIGPNQTYAYDYTGDPKYLGSGWDQKYRGFEQVKETDAAGDYVKHYFYATGTVGGKDGEKLTGREYKTQWYTSGNTLLREKLYDWSAVTTSQSPDVMTYWGGAGGAGGQFYGPDGIAVSSGGNVYVVDDATPSASPRVLKLDTDGNYALNWTYAYFSGPGGAATDSSGNVYVASTGNDRILKFDSSGNYSQQFGYGTRGSQLGQFDTPEDATVSTTYGIVYVADTNNHRVQGFTLGGSFAVWFGGYGPNPGQLIYPWGVAADSIGNVYVADTGNNRIEKFGPYGNYLGAWGTYGSGNGQFMYPRGIAVYSTGTYPNITGFVYVTDDNKWVQKFDLNGTFISKWTLNYPAADVAANGDSIYVAVAGDHSVRKIQPNWTVQLAQVDENTGAKSSRTRYLYDSYGNVVTEYVDGDTSTNADDATVWRVFYPNTTANIVGKPARERVYATIMTADSGGANLKKETLYYYDGAVSYTAPPAKGNITRQEGKKDVSNSVSSYFTYDSYGNELTSQDPNGNTTTWTYETTHHVYPATKTYPVTSLSESYTFEAGTENMLSKTDVNGQTTTYEYDTFKRLVKVIRPGDTSGSPSVEYQYNNWGTINQQHLKTLTKVAAGDYLFSSQFFDGVGRVVQVQARGETGRTIIAGTTVYNTRGSVDKQYVSQDLDSASVSGYKAPEAAWKYSTLSYDALGRTTGQTSFDGTTASHDFSTAWQDLATNELGHKKRSYFDAFQRLVKVEELDASFAVYATTTYSYDVLGNLTQVVDTSSNTTSITYDWLSRKTAMTDPDMGGWSYGYDSNGNLTSQTDARSNTISLSYDAMNRLTGKTYPAGLGMTNITYTHDSTAGGNYGKGKRTGMTDALGSSAYKYDTRGRMIEEKRTVDTVDYTTGFTYDGADRNLTVVYPTGEAVTQAYNNRGLPYSLSGTVAGTLVSTTSYNGLGKMTEVNLGNSIRTIFGYWGVGGTYDNAGGYYGRLWRIKTSKQPGDAPVLQDVKHTWDAGGNLSSREDVLASETESFSYDFLDRLTGVSGPYTESYAYNQIGNMTSKNGVSYTYGTKPHAVTAVGATSYVYDNNGNMTSRGTQTLTWDVENRPVTIVDGGNTSTFVYDGDGKRGKRTEAGATVLYVNRYYEKNTTSGEITSHYYLGDREVAFKKGATVEFLHQDLLTGTSVTSDSAGASVGTIKYFPFGGTRSTGGTLDTDKKFTGQRLDGTGLYYYNARYYDPVIGRFISPDSVVQMSPSSAELNLALAVSFYDSATLSDLRKASLGSEQYKGGPLDPQLLNRYTYARDNPLKFKDSSGHWIMAIAAVVGGAIGLGTYISTHQGSFEWREAVSYTGIGAVSAASAVTIIPVVVPIVAGFVAIAAGSIGAMIPRGLNYFTYAEQYGIRKVAELKQEFVLKGLEVHHLIEKRFAERFGWDVGEIPGIVLTEAEHQAFTKALRGQIAYRNSLNPLNTLTAGIDDVLNAYRVVYAQYPDILEAVEQFFAKVK